MNKNVAFNLAHYCVAVLHRDYRSRARMSALTWKRRECFAGLITPQAGKIV